MPVRRKELRRKGQEIGTKESKIGYLFLAPLTIIVADFFTIPICKGIYIIIF